MLFVPIWDKNPLESVRFQYVTVSLILINVAVYFLLELGYLMPLTEAQLVALGLTPKNLIAHGLLKQMQPAVDPQQAPLVPYGLTLITYMFLHADFWHLLGNMVFLWVFGDNVEDAMGHLKFLFFYLLCGIFAGLTHAFISASSETPLIGASGAVAGVIAAYLMLHPNVRAWVLFLFKIPIPLRLSAGFILGVWILLQVISVVFNIGGSTAWWAHIGGFVAGAVLVIFMRRPGIPLFDRATGL